jgi:WD40 repeat protein
LGSIVREESAIRSISLLVITPPRADGSIPRGAIAASGTTECARVCVACADGNVGIWDVHKPRRLGSIDADKEWISSRGDMSQGGWIDSQRHHTGALTALKLSPNGQLLATVS